MKIKLTIITIIPEFPKKTSIGWYVDWLEKNGMEWNGKEKQKNACTYAYIHD